MNVYQVQIEFTFESLSTMDSLVRILTIRRISHCGWPSKYHTTTTLGHRDLWYKRNVYYEAALLYAIVFTDKSTYRIPSSLPILLAVLPTRLPVNSRVVFRLCLKK